MLIARAPPLTCQVLIGALDLLGDRHLLVASF
jgi:hypothetical protein